MSSQSPPSTRVSTGYLGYSPSSLTQSIAPWTKAAANSVPGAFSASTLAKLLTVRSFSLPLHMVRNPQASTDTPPLDTMLANPTPGTPLATLLKASRQSLRIPRARSGKRPILFFKLFMFILEPQTKYQKCLLGHGRDFLSLHLVRLKLHESDFKTLTFYVFSDPFYNIWAIIISVS